MEMTTIPDGVPVLSRGRHRNPRKGACFMEFASYLAGEPWSDHPPCTHPTLAALARGVNDQVSDSARAAMVPLIPDVVGLNGDDRSVELWIARHCALTALPVVPEPRQRVLALAVIRIEEELADLEGRPTESMTPLAQLVLGDVPGAHLWAARYIRQSRTAGAGVAARTSVAAVLENAVLGIAESVEADRDEMLLALLRAAIGYCQETLERRPPVRAPAPSGLARRQRPGARARALLGRG